MAPCPQQSLQCRACGAPAGRPILDLGHQPLANNLLLSEEQFPLEPRFPLRVFVCPNCYLMQIADDIPPVRLFTEYLYFSSFSDTMQTHARQAAERYAETFHLGAASRVVEIASNDGYLLRHFVQRGIPALGIEPAANIARVALEHGIPTRVEFFNSAVAEKLVCEGHTADLVLGNNVFAHVPDINDFVHGLERLLKPEGCIILEFPYAVQLIQNTEFDTIYHEHVFYFTLTALIPLFGRQGLTICDVEQLPIHGGSLRIFARRTGRAEPAASVTRLLAAEKAQGVTSLDYYQDFASAVDRLRCELLELVTRLKQQGASLAAYGASAKGSTLLNAFGLGRETLDFIVDRSSYKWGRLTPGTHLPILPAEELSRRRPDYTLLLTWNFADEILVQQQAYRRQGGRFIVPIPHPAIR